MKKILIIVLTIALVFSLCAGCNNRGPIEDDDLGPIVIGGTSDDDSGDKPDDKPDDNDNPGGDASGEWPNGLPSYPDGEISRIEPKEYDRYAIYIINTSRAAMDDYAGILTNEGWECSRVDDDSTFVYMFFDKDNYNISLVLSDDGTSLKIDFYRVLDKEELPKEWPAGHLPQGFPEYPDGDIFRIRIDESGKLFIEIKDSSQGSFDKYVTTLKDAGWEIEEAGTDNMDVCYFNKDSNHGSISFYKPDGSIDIWMN